MKMMSLKRLSTISLLWAISTPLVSGQRTTYTGCHNHTEASATIEYCYGPDGAETARATHAVTGSASLPESVSASATVEPQTTAVTGCHTHETAVFCINGAGEEVHVEATPTGEVPPAYTSCHAHDTETYGPCLRDLHSIRDTNGYSGSVRTRTITTSPCMPNARLRRKAMKTPMETHMQSRRSRTAISTLVLSMLYPILINRPLLTKFTGIALVGRARKSPAASVSASTTWDCGLDRSS